jgi:hypothetical protein
MPEGTWHINVHLEQIFLRDEPNDLQKSEGRSIETMQTLELVCANPSKSENWHPTNPSRKRSFSYLASLPESMEDQRHKCLPAFQLLLQIVLLAKSYAEQLPDICQRTKHATFLQAAQILLKIKEPAILKLCEADKISHKPN